MSKFSKFLEEDNVAIKKVKIHNTEELNKYSSLKIKVNTLDNLRKLKLVTKEESYSVLISKMIDNYIKELSTEEQEKFNILR